MYPTHSDTLEHAINTCQISQRVINSSQRVQEQESLKKTMEGGGKGERAKKRPRATTTASEPRRGRARGRVETKATREP